MRQARGFEEWAVQERERLHHLVLDALRETVAFHLRAGTYKQGIRLAHRLLGLDPLMESAHRQLMQLLAASGQRGAALAQFETLRQLLEAELGDGRTIERKLDLPGVRSG